MSDIALERMYAARERTEQMLDYYHKPVRLCPQCAGIGQLFTGVRCQTCDGNGEVTEFQWDVWQESVSEGRNDDYPDVDGREDDYPDMDEDEAA